jgi:peptidyl-prolyl cis-trans isomerase D
MLRAMRNDFKKYSWTLWLVILAFVLGFILTDAFGGNRRKKSGLIFINDEAVVKGDEFQQQLMRQLDRYKEQYKDNFNKSMVGMATQQVLRSMMSQAVLKAEAERLNITASEQELKKAILEEPIITQNYEYFLKYRPNEIPVFERQLQDSIIFEKLQELVTGSLVMDKDSLLKEFKKEKDQAELDYILFKPERIKDEIKVEDSEINDYYQKNKDDFKSQEKRAGYVIAFKFDDYKKDVTVDATEEYEYFKNNRKNYIIPGRTKVSRIFLKYDEKNREEILKKAEKMQKELTKENFADYAKAYSEDDKAQNGGDLGFQGWKSFTSQEKTMIENLAENAISTPIDTLQGFSIVHITEKVADRRQDLNEVKTKINDTLAQEKVNKLVMDKLDTIYKKLKDTKDFKTEAEKMGLTVIETEMMTSGQKIKDVDDMGYISRKLFSLEDKEIAFPVQFIKGIAIVQLANIEEPVVETLEKVKDDVKAKVVAAKKAELLKVQASNIAERLNKITDDKKVAEFLKKEDLKTEPLVYRRGDRFAFFAAQKGTDDIVFAAAENSYQQPLVFNSNVVIYKIKTKTINSEAEFNKNRDEFYKTKVTQLKNTYFQSFLNQKTQAYNVTMNQELYDKIKEWVSARYN